MAKTILYTGCYQETYWSSTFGEPDIAGHGEGVAWRAFDAATGDLGAAEWVGGLINPAALCASPDGRLLFAASDTRDFINYQHSSGGGVYAFRVERDGSLVNTDLRSSCGVRAVDLCCDRTGRYLLVVNAGSMFCTTEFLRGEDGRYRPHIHRDEACVTLLRVDEDGAFARVCDRQVLSGDGQLHPHVAVFAGDDHIFVADGNGGVQVLRFERDRERLQFLSACEMPGGQPCALALHPSQPLLFCGDRARGCVETLHFDASAGRLERYSQAMLLPAAPDGAQRRLGALVLAPDGGYLYASAHDHAELTAFAVDKDGTLHAHQSCTDGLEQRDGFGVRTLHVGSGGRWLFAACPTLDAVAVYAIDAHSGALTHAGNHIAATPVGLCSVVL